MILRPHFNNLLTVGGVLDVNVPGKCMVKKVPKCEMQENVMNDTIK